MIGKLFLVLPLFWVSAPSALALYQKMGVPLWLAVVMNVGKSLVYMVCASYCTELAIRGLGCLTRKFPKIESVVLRWRRWRDSMAHGNSFSRRNIVKGIVSWLLRMRKELVVACAFMAFVPFMPTAIIIAFDVMKIRRGFLILALATIFRSGVYSLVFYSLSLFD